MLECTSTGTLSCSGKSPTIADLNRTGPEPYLGFLNPQFGWWNASVCWIRNDDCLMLTPSGRCSGSERHGGHTDAHDTDLDEKRKLPPEPKNILDFFQNGDYNHETWVHHVKGSIQSPKPENVWVSRIEISPAQNNDGGPTNKSYDSLIWVKGWASVDDIYVLLTKIANRTSVLIHSHTGPNYTSWSWYMCYLNNFFMGRTAGMGMPIGKKGGWHSTGKNDVETKAEQRIVKVEGINHGFIHVGKTRMSLTITDHVSRHCNHAVPFCSHKCPMTGEINGNSQRSLTLIVQEHVHAIRSSDSVWFYSPKKQCLKNMNEYCYILIYLYPHIPPYYANIYI